MLAVFLTEPSLEQWRKQTSVSLEEEALTKRLDKVEEMSIPSDLEDKLKYVCHTAITAVSLMVAKDREEQAQHRY